MPDPTDTLLSERAKTHGRFEDNARISQNIKDIFHGERAYHSMTNVQKEALDCIALKLCRILSGQGGYADHWDDIAGYAQLASKAIKEK